MHGPGDFVDRKGPVMSSANAHQDHGLRPGHRGAAWTLVVLTPLIAELAFGSTPIRWGYLVLLWIPVYGSGVLLIRELVRRTGRGWPSILLLGLGYGLLEDGIGLQALTSPNLYDAADWGMRVAGMNLAYWEATAIYHVVFSAAIPIALTELIFGKHGRRPYLRTGGLVVAALVTVLGVLVLRFTVPIAQDPGYQAPLPFVAGALVTALVIGLVALRLLPRSERSPTDRPVAALSWWYVGSFVTAVGYLALSHPMFGAEQPAFTDGDLVVFPMIAVVALVVGCLVVLRTAVRSSHWTERHTLAVIGGALVGHTAAGVAITAFVERTVVDRIGLGVIAIATVVIIVLLDRRIREMS
ncbi:hypothetical protein [Microlunatus sp. GCM10028923]|uniref:hypothetical protein n=1 Tax=Microlunatus sp. GCM10028923 TaxID=3273400 RepID=UPI00360706A8